MKIILINRFSRMLFEKPEWFFSSLKIVNTDWHVIHALVNTADHRTVTAGFLTTWVTVDNSSKCVVVLISMLGRVIEAARHLFRMLIQKDVLCKNSIDLTL